MRSFLLDRVAVAVGAVLQVILLTAAPSALAEKRVALVVGISRYEHIPALDNPKNDARLMAETLRGLGFAVVGGGAQLDLDKPSFDRAIQAFGQQLLGAQVALFYFAGHGLQVRGANWLVPTNANPTREADVDFQMVDAGLVLRQMEGAGTKLNMVILDACRNNPFGGRGLRASAGGLAQMQAPEGTLISYATQPGNVAQDGVDGNSPFTKALSQSMRRPGVDVFRMFNDVGLQVKRATGGAQQPWVSNSPIDGDFYFAGTGGGGSTPAASAPAAPAAAPTPSGIGGDAELVFWQTITNSADPTDFEEYLRQYPNGRFAGLARTRAQARPSAPQQQAMVVPPPMAPAVRPATDFPAGPVRLVVPYAAGGSTDVAARVIANGLAKIFKANVVVENRAGAGGDIGFAAVAAANPDGHTLAIAPVAITSNRAMFAQPPFDVKRDLAPVILLSHTPYVLVVPAGLAASSVRGLIDLAKNRGISFASAGMGSFSHLAAEQFRQLSGIAMEHIPYRGEGPALQDVLAEQTQLMFLGMATAADHFRAGRLRALAVTTARRSSALPDVPTLAEAGVGGYAASAWVGAMVPIRTPPAIVARLNAEMNAVLRTAEVGETLAKIGSAPAGGTPAEFEQLIDSELARWARVARAAGIKPQ